jgi:threonine dehydrogenase-like Zn-dependent dehydrogenase
MRAAQIVAPRRIELVDIPEPTLKDAGPGMIKVRLERACLCGSDSPFFAYDFAETAYPMRPGLSIHECLGTVVESTSTRFREGDFVLALPKEHQGGLCECFCVPDALAIHLPREGVPLEQILMTQPLGTVIWACQKLGNLLDKDVVIVGQGPMGLLFSHMMSNLGARHIITLDKLDYRLEASRKMRATHTFNVEREDAVAAVQEITQGKMADLVVEVVGHGVNTMDLCLNLVRRLGTVLFFGVPDAELEPNFPMLSFFRKNINLISSVGPDVVPNFSLARDMIAQGRINVAPLVTHVLPFQEIQKAYELFVNRKDGAIKVVLNYETLH